MLAAPQGGTVVGTRYRLESVVGEGGMAVVWLATHTETDRKVALKLVRPEFITDDRVREMFVREARVASRIGKSAHIVDVLDAGVDEQLGVPFMAMELLAGQPLDQRLRLAGPIPQPLACTLLLQLAEALDQAHAAGVIHRDLKPQNLFVGEDRKGQPELKVLDFGIAKLAESALDSSTHVGTPAYSAPEQLGPSWRALAEQRGRRIAPHVSAQTDIWALGLIAYEILTGSTSGGFWGAETLAELPVKMVLEPLPSARQRAGGRAALLPEAFDGWIARCLELDSVLRPASASEAVRGLLALFAASPATAQPYRDALSSAPPLLAHTPPPQGPPLAGAYAASGAGWSQPPAPDANLAAWARHRGAELRVGDPRLYAELPPLAFLPRVERVPREARLVLPGVALTLAEVFVDDALRKATAEDRMLIAVLQSARVQYRASLRSKRLAGGFAEGFSRGLRALDSLMAADASGLLRDPHFEHLFEVSGPSAAEAHAAIPHAMRALLLQAGFVGIVELRVGFLVMTFFDPAQGFEPGSLERLCEASMRLLNTLG